MLKTILFSTILGFLINPCFAQKEQDKTVLSPETTRQLLSELKPDTAKILAETSSKACQCIDSFMQARKAGDGTNILVKVNSCIDEEVLSYQSVMKIYQSFTSAEKNIIINSNKNSAEYKKYYSDIEAWLKDSCSALKLALGSNDEEETELSFSKDPEAIKQYNLGINYLTAEDYQQALPYFKNATEADPKFVFALDNLAICYRKTNDLDKAIATYNKSLELSPRGKTPLQNIPVIHELKKDYDKALLGYKKLLEYYPENVEAFYGMGRVSIAFLQDYENGVDYMCKAYNIYVKEKSPYRIDAEKNLAYAYQKMKEQGKEEIFYKILKDNNISVK